MKLWFWPLVALLLLTACSVNYKNASIPANTAGQDTLQVIVIESPEPEQISSDNENTPITETAITELKQDFESLDSLRAELKVLSVYQSIASLQTALHNANPAVKDLQKQMTELKSRVQTLLTDPNIKPNPGISIQSFDNRFNEFDTQLAALEDFVIRLETQVSSSLSQRDRPTADLPLIKIDRNASLTQAEPVIKIQPQPAVEIPSPQVSDADAIALYEKAREVYENDNLVEAASRFHDFLIEHPQHELASNAQYWLGETHYAAGSYAKAIEELQKVLDDYPGARKAPDAQFKIGMSWLRLGNKTRAKAELEKIASLYPDYERMDLVDKQLKKLR